MGVCVWARFSLDPATLGSGVGLCVCWCGRSACTLPLLAGVPAVGVCVWARVPAAPRHSWLGCWGVYVPVCVPPLYPATPGWGVRCGCVCLGSIPAAPHHSLLGCWGVCVPVYVPPLYPATPGWDVRCGCVCLGSGFGCAPPLLAGVLGCVCAGVRAPHVPRLFWLGCAAWVCVLGLGFWLRPATPRWGLWCLGWLLLGTCSCALVCCVLCALSGFVAPGSCRCLAPVRVHWLWPAACLSGVPRGPAWCAAPLPVRSLSVLRSALQLPWCLSPSRGLAPPALLGGCAGHAEAGREPGSLCLPLAPAEAGALGSLRVVPVRGPAMGLSLAGPSGVGYGLRALRWLACVNLVTDVSGFPDRPSFDRRLGWCNGAVDADTAPCGSEDATPGSRACVRVFAYLGRVGGPASLARSGACLSFFFWLLWLSAVLGRSVPCVFFFPCPRPVCLSFSLVSGPGCLGPWRCGLRFLFLSPVGSPCALVFFSCFAVGCSLVLGPPPLLRLCLAGFVAAARCPPPFFFLLRAPPLSLAFSGFRPRVPWALALCFVCSVGLLLLGSPCALFFLPCLAWPLVAPWWLLPPPPPAAW